MRGAVLAGGLWRGGPADSGHDHDTCDERWIGGAGVCDFGRKKPRVRLAHAQDRRRSKFLRLVRVFENAADVLASLPWNVLAKT